MCFINCVRPILNNMEYVINKTYTNENDHRKRTGHRQMLKVKKKKIYTPANRRININMDLHISREKRERASDSDREKEKRKREHARNAKDGDKIVCKWMVKVRLKIYLTDIIM